jgi:hypothetical protein
MNRGRLSVVHRAGSAGDSFYRVVETQVDFHVIAEVSDRVYVAVTESLDDLTFAVLGLTFAVLGDEAWMWMPRVA